MTDNLNKAPLAPPLLFAGVEDLPRRFNTFRLGGKWGNQAKCGDIVTLAHVNEDGSQGEQIGLGRIVALHAGNLGELLKQHAGDNHANIDAELKGKTAEKWLVEVLEDVYGADAVDLNEHYTVVYVKRISPEVVVDNDQGDEEEEDENAEEQDI